MEHYVVEFFLIGLVIFKEIVHNNEKKELLDRIMARNFQELITFQGERDPVSQIKEEPSRFEL